SGSASIDQVVQVLREAVTDAVAPAPLRHAFRDARHLAVAAVAERDHRQHAAGDVDDLAARGRRADADPVVQALVAGPLGFDLGPHDALVVAAATVDVAGVHLAAVAVHGEERHRSEIVPEAHGQPAVVARRLPVPRAPRVVAQAGRVEVVARAVDDERTHGLAVLLEVPFRELL